MQAVIPSRLAAPAALIAVMVALAGCADNGSSAAGTASTSAAAATAASTAASAPAGPATPAKPSRAAASAPAGTPTAAASTAASAPAGPATPAKPSQAAAPAPAKTPTARTPTAAASTPRSAQTASALLDSAISAMLARKSVHLACSYSTSNGVSTDSDDVSTASGRIVSTASNFTTTELEVNRVAYFSTDNTQVLTVQGVPAAEAKKLTGGWISFRPGDSYGNLYLNYTTMTHGLTLASQADALRLAGALKRTGTTRSQGVAVYGVSGGASPYYSIFANDVKGSTETVYIAAGGAPLPVSVSAHSTSGAVTTCNFSNWGEPVTITAPANAVPVTTLPAG